MAFDFISPHDFVETKKSWFFFDKEYVCLGTGIKSEQNLPVATTINQVLMRSEVTVSQGGKIRILPEGSRELEQVKWVCHDRIGYIFPKPAQISLSNRTETGRWSDITDQKNISDAIVSEKVFTLWFDHGESSQNGSYHYIVVPNVAVSELDKSSSTNRDIEILANTSEIQAVEHTKQGICQIAFYRAGEVRISNGVKVRMNSQGMAMLRMNGKRIQKLSVSDPSRKLAAITLTVSGVYDGRGDSFYTKPDRGENCTEIVIDLPQGVYAGKSVSLEW